MSSRDKSTRRLTRALDANVPGGARHAIVALPSFSLSESTLSHYAPMIPALEHRYLAVLPMLERIRSCELIYVCSSYPGHDVLDYHFSLISPEIRDDALRRFHLFELADETPRALAEKLIERPDVIEQIRRVIDVLPAFIEPWNVTAAEMTAAERLGIPIDGTDPALWPIGFKSEGRRLFRQAGVPIPEGVEDIRSVDDAVRAVDYIRLRRPEAGGVVIKHDNAGDGDGNAVIRFDDIGPGTLRHRLDALPDWYLADLAAGSVVEELISGTEFSSPSAQVDIRPGGGVIVRATHEQILGGPDGQTFTGCRFPARPDYAPALAGYASDVARVLADLGVIGRFSVDFAASRDDGQWRAYALELNLRKGGTTHPYAALRQLVPGRYDAAAGVWRADAGGTRSYVATDRVGDPAWLGLRPLDVAGHLNAAGLGFNKTTGTGVAMHMLSGLARDGQFGLTAIGLSPNHADETYTAALERLASLTSGS